MVKSNYTVGKKIISFLIVTVIFASVFYPAEIVNVSAADDSESRLKEIQETLKLTPYTEYLNVVTKEHMSKYDGLPLGKDHITITADNFDRELSDADMEIRSNVEGVSGNSVYTSNEGKAVFNFTVETEGLYNIRLTAMPVIGKTSTVERSMYIDNKIPFKEARDITIQKTYVDDYLYDDNGNAIFKTDTKGNEIRPKKLEVSEWKTFFIEDASGFVREPLYFYLSAGEHTMTIESVREPLVINKIEVFVAEKPVSYEQYIAEHKANGATQGTAVIQFEAEYSSAVSDIGIYPLNDRTSAITQPQDASKIKMNAIGSDSSTVKWQVVGQWIRWEFEVPAGGAGLYQIVPRFKQNKYAGVYSSRKLTLDGAVPFEEAERLRFNYKDEWQTEALNDGTTEFEFYLSEGKHTIEFEVVLGDMADLLGKIDKSLLNLNSMYREIYMITGSNPDAYRDYGFEKTIPHVLKGMQTESENLYAYSKELEEIIGAKGEQTVILDKIALQLKKMSDDTDKIAINLGTYKTNIGSLATWLFERKYQPLLLDYIQIQNADTKLPKDKAGFFESVFFELKAFFVSFFTDYSVMGSTIENSSKGDEVNVWLELGRDQAQVLRQMIDEDFATVYNIPTSVKLVAANTLLPATLAGTGPDVSVFSTGDKAVNYAIRSAVLPLNDFEGDESKGIAGFDEVITWFNPAALVPLTLQDDTLEDKSQQLVYGLPETQTFPMMFYRKDILAEMNVEIPETWEDLFAIIPALQKQNLEVGIAPGLSTLQIFMYQNKEPFYLGDGIKINLDSNTALDAFRKMCELYTIYKFPTVYDFPNRFRNGEMPIGIASYDIYNQLIVFATEIRGLWEFVPLPGTVREKTAEDEGKNYKELGNGLIIDNDSPAGVSCIMMMRTAEKRNPENTWAFMQWWVSAKAQSRYCNEMVALMGPAAKQPTANIQALSEMPWITSDYKNLEAQFEHLTGTPEVPGGYIVARYVDFAWRAVYNDGVPPIETMLDYIPEINKELTRKRKEFDMEVIEDKKINKRLSDEIKD